LINNITYQNTSEDPTAGNRTVTLTQIKDSGGTANGGVDTSTLSIASSVNVIAVNDAPTLSVGISNISYTENAAATVINNALTVADVDNTTLLSATVVISGNYTAGEDVLSFTSNPATMGNIVGVISGNTLTLTSSGGIATLAQFQAALRSVQYSNSSDNPSTATRTIQFTVNDGASDSNVISTTVTVTAVNDAPIISDTSGSYNVNEQTNLTLSGTGISVADVDAGTGNLQVTLAVGEGVISANVGSTGATVVSGSGTGSLVLSGTITQLNNLLAGLNSSSIIYNNGSDTPSASTALTMSINDLGNTGIGGALSNSIIRSINITAINDAPTIIDTSGSYSVTEQTNLVLSGTGISIADVDAGNGNLQVTLTVGEGAMTANIGSTGATIVSGSGSGSLVLSGTITQLNNLLAGLNSGSITFNNGSDTPSASTVLTLTVNDQGNTGAGGALSNTITRTINQIPVNDAPVLTGPSTITYTENDAATVINNTIALQDVDSPILANATVAISNYQAGEDILSFTPNPPATGNIIANFNSTTGVLTLTSSDDSGTVAQFEAALRSVKYSNTSDHPASAARDIIFVVNDGSSANNLSDVVHSTVNVIAVNDAPVLGGAQQTISYVANDPAKIIDPTITVTDIDDPANFNGGYLQISITAGLTVNDQLSISTNAQITVSGNNVSYAGVSFGTIDSVMNGTNGHELKISFNTNASPEAVQALSQSIAFANNAAITATATRTVVYEFHDGGNVGIGGDLVAYKSNTVSVLGNPNPPTIIAIPENAGNGINMEEVQSAGGSVVDISLNNTGANAGDMLTINWGNSTVIYLLNNADIAANQANVNVPTATILAEGDGNINVTAKITNQSNRNSGLSAPVVATVDTYVAETNTNAETTTFSANPILLTGKLLGSVHAGDVLSVQVGGLSYAINMSAGANSWAVELPGNMAAGVYSVTTTLTDLVGNQSQTVGVGSLIIEASSTTSTASNSAIDLPITYRTDVAAQTGAKSGASIARGIIDTRTLGTSRYNVPASWGWYNLPEFVDLNPIVRGLSQTVNNLIKNDNGGDPIGTRNVLNTFSTKPISFADYQMNQPLSTVSAPIDSEKVSELDAINALNTSSNTADQTANIVKDVLESKQNVAEKPNFQAKIKNLLKDFGIDD